MKNTLTALSTVLILLASGCLSQRAIELEGVEVREYRGEKLSSINDFRENSIKGPQYVNLSGYVLEVSGLVENPREYAYEDVLSLRKYSKVVTLHCVEGWSVGILWEGILVEDLLEDVGVKPEANTVIFHAYDGYSTSLPLQYILDNDIIMAYRMNNVTLPPERGFPFQLVAEDKWGYKWVKWITRIELSDNAGYRGTWERRGYNQKGDVSGPVFENE
jgi:DMSO/TMAO reductase YedYZ molybdopterin-dependent catalytic subunit